MTLEEILRRLKIVEDEKTKSIRDEMRINMLHLLIFPDGSGQVQADWSKYREEMCREEMLLHSIFSVDGPIFEFDNLKELETWLLEQTKEAP